jgi:acyl-CoA thioester hydrolase
VLQSYTAYAGHCNPKHFCSFAGMSFHPDPPTGYAFTLAIPTRWGDNDVYGHVNNVEYYAFFDTVINHWLIHEGGLDIEGGETIGLCAESHCEYRAAVAFPDVIEAALRVGHLGRSSVRYELALYRSGGESPVAVGWFVHVFVDRDRRRPVEIPGSMRGALERLIVPEEAAR